MDEKNEGIEQTEAATPSKEALAPEHEKSKPEKPKADSDNVEYASFIERFLALLIDAIIFGFVFGIFFSLWQNLLPGMTEQLGFVYNPLATLLIWKPK